MNSRSIFSSFCRQAVRPTSSSCAASTVRNAVLPLRARASPPILKIRRLISEQTRVAIDKAVASAPIVLFMKGTPEMPRCGFSLGVIQILSKQGVNPANFAAFNVLESEDLRSGIKEYSEWPTIPQLYIEKEFIGGADIVQQMFKSGDLGKVLGDKGLLISATKIEGRST